MSAYDTVTARLAERTGSTGRNGWLCPAHDDSTPSLSVTNGDRKVLLHCHAGCNVVDIATALGLEVADLFDEQPTGNRAEIVATYDYADEEGTYLFQVVRYFPKGFKQRRPGGAGAWIWKLDDTRRVLYRLPEVTQAIDQLQTIYVVEGEKDADRLVRSGEVATCNPGGVGKWRREYTNMLLAAHIVIVADRDGPGRKHAKKVHAELTGTATVCKWSNPRSVKTCATTSPRGEASTTSSRSTTSRIPSWARRPRTLSGGRDRTGSGASGTAQGLGDRERLQQHDEGVGGTQRRGAGLRFLSLVPERRAIQFRLPLRSRADRALLRTIHQPSGWPGFDPGCCPTDRRPGGGTRHHARAGARVG